MESKTDLFKSAFTIVALNAALCFSAFAEDDRRGSDIAHEDKTGAKHND